MGRWTADQAGFLRAHGFSRPKELALDATGLTRREFQVELKSQGKLFVYGVAPCKNGHTLRTAGGCPQCNTAYLAFARQQIAPGYVYLARSNSRRLIKLGSSRDPENRIYIANLEGYGGACDWRLRAAKFVAEMGHAEAALKRRLTAYSCGVPWIRNGSETMTRETYRCTLSAALGAIESEFGATA